MSIDPNIREALVQAGQQALEAMAGQDEVEFAPMLTAEWGGVLHAYLVAGGFPEHTYACHHILEEAGSHRLTMLVQTIDGYYLGVGTKEEAEAAAGTLAERFEAGDPNVSECLSITIVTADDMYYTRLPYRRKGNRVIWRPDARHEQTGLDVTGDFPTLLRFTIEKSLSKDT